MEGKLKMAFARSLVVSALACFGVSAGAQSLSRLVPAETCEFAARFPGTFEPSGQARGAGISETGEHFAKFMCPFVDERDNPYGLEHGEVRRVNAHVSIGHHTGYAEVSLCARNYNGSHVDCGQFAINPMSAVDPSRSVPGDHTLQLTSPAHLAAWRAAINAHDFAYVHVALGTRHARFNGYWASTN